MRQATCRLRGAGVDEGREPLMVEPTTEGRPGSIPRGVRRGVAAAGSRLRIQQYVHSHQASLNSALRAHDSLDAWLAVDPDWRSPIAERDFLEFRDDVWYELGLPEPTPKGAGFWPSGGPQWD